MPENGSTDKIIYGPTHSSRFGSSLGLNVLPGKYILCPFDTIYCSTGTPLKIPDTPSEFQPHLPSPQEIRKALINYLEKQPPVDYITFSGNGEPTVHPEFEKIVDEVIAVRDEFASHLDICIISNGAYIADETVRNSLQKVEVPILKLDAGDSVLYRKICQEIRRDANLHSGHL